MTIKTMDLRPKKLFDEPLAKLTGHFVRVDLRISAGIIANRQTARLPAGLFGPWLETQIEVEEKLSASKDGHAPDGRIRLGKRDQHCLKIRQCVGRQKLSV